MKVARLEIDSFRHLENLTFDFTYQSGPRKGQPLDKICFIGQSATGKTSLLELIKNNFFHFDNLPNESRIDYDNGGERLIFDKKTVDFKISKLDFFKIKEKRKLYYFSSDQLSEENFENVLKNKENKDAISNIIMQLSKETELQKSYKFIDLLRKNILEFNYSTNKIIWDFILDKLIVYRDKANQKGSDLLNQKLAKDFELVLRDIEKWRKENPNPLEKLAIECLNPILKKLNLEVDLNDVSSPIPLKPINENTAIPANALSTGTKQLILNSLPLYKLPTDDSIIIIDEPERSLYPDIQMELIPFYQSLAPNAQFIVATHSPFVAASFEPEERFILYFDEKGKVQFRNGVSPIGDDPNDILKNDFGLEYLMNSKGIEAYKKYLDLKQKMASEKDEKKKKELLKEVVSLGDKYMF